MMVGKLKSAMLGYKSLGDLVEVLVAQPKPSTHRPSFL